MPKTKQKTSKSNVKIENDDSSDKELELNDIKELELNDIIDLLNRHNKGTYNDKFLTIKQIPFILEAAKQIRNKTKKNKDCYKLSEDNFGNIDYSKYIEERTENSKVSFLRYFIGKKKCFKREVRRIKNIDEVIVNLAKEILNNANTLCNDYKMNDFK